MTSVLEAQETAPALPGFSDNETNSLKSRSRARSQESEERLFLAWQQRAEADAEAALVFAEQNESSGMAWARSAQAQWAAGRIEHAAVHAEWSFRELTRATANGGKLDIPAVHAAFQVLFLSGNREAAATALARLPRTESVALLWALVDIDAGNLDRALTALKGDSSAASASLRGYILLLKDEIPRAVRELRDALERTPDDVDARYNLALAFKRLGSNRKALRHASEVMRLAPGRKDVTMSYLELLAAEGRWTQLRKELRDHQDSDIADIPDYVICQARESLSRGDTERALALMDKAQAYADRDGRTEFAQEIAGNKAMVEWAGGRITRAGAWQRVRSAARVATESLALLDMLADIAFRRSDALAVKEYLGGLPSSSAGDVRIVGAEARIAYLECRFSDALSLSLRWVDASPDDVVAVSGAMLLAGHIGDDWARAAQMARQALKRSEITAFLANQAAFTLALAGDYSAALASLERSPKWDHRLEATSGLVAIGMGRVEEGLRRYRKALALAEKDHESPYDPALMALFQAMALRRLGLHQTHAPLIRAAALPSLSLPDDWRDIPMFVMLRQVAERESWSWPISID